MTRDVRAAFFFGGGRGWGPGTHILKLSSNYNVQRGDRSVRGLGKRGLKSKTWAGASTQFRSALSGHRRDAPSCAWDGHGHRSPRSLYAVLQPRPSTWALTLHSVRPTDSEVSHRSPGSCRRVGRQRADLTGGRECYLSPRPSLQQVKCKYPVRLGEHGGPPGCCAVSSQPGFPGDPPCHGTLPPQTAMTLSFKKITLEFIIREFLACFLVQVVQIPAPPFTR